MALINSSPGQISCVEVPPVTFPSSVWDIISFSDEIVLQPGIIFVEINLCISFFSLGKKKKTAVVKRTVKTKPWGKTLPFSSVLVVTKVVSDNFQVYLCDEMCSNSTHVSQGKNKTCARLGWHPVDE